MGKSSKIRHIVRLRQMLRRWRHRASSRFSSSIAAAPDVPAGHVAVCVGSTSRRFVVRASVLNHPAFRRLLVEAEEEYGFSRPGPLALPCDESHFEHVLRHVTSDPSSCHVGLRAPWQHQHQDSLPLLRGSFVEEAPVW